MLEALASFCSQFKQHVTHVLDFEVTRNAFSAFVSATLSVGPMGSKLKALLRSSDYISRNHVCRYCESFLSNFSWAFAVIRQNGSSRFAGSKVTARRHGRKDLQRRRQTADRTPQPILAECTHLVDRKCLHVPKPKIAQTAERHVLTTCSGPPCLALLR